MNTGNYKYNEESFNDEIPVSETEELLYNNQNNNSEVYNFNLNFNLKSKNSKGKKHEK